MSDHSHHDEHSQKEESALVKILAKEKELENATAGAKQEADRIIYEAKAKAEEMINAAKKDIIAAEQVLLTARDSKAAKKVEAADWEKAEVEEIKKKFSANKSKTVAMIVEAVMPQ